MLKKFFAGAAALAIVAGITISSANAQAQLYRYSDLGDQAQFYGPDGDFALYSGSMYRNGRSDVRGLLDFLNRETDGRHVWLQTYKQGSALGVCFDVNVDDDYFNPQDCEVFRFWDHI